MLKMGKISQVALVGLSFLLLGCNSKSNIEDREEVMRKVTIAMDKNRNMSDEQKIKYLKPYCDEDIGELCFTMLLWNQTKIKI